MGTDTLKEDLLRLVQDVEDAEAYWTQESNCYSRNAQPDKAADACSKAWYDLREYIKNKC